MPHKAAFPRKRAARAQPAAKAALPAPRYTDRAGSRALDADSPLLAQSRPGRHHGECYRMAIQQGSTIDRAISATADAMGHPM